MSLKKAAKERLLWAVKQVVVPFGRVVMLVDPKSLKVVSSCCTVSELMDEGVDLVELLTKRREPLRGKNVICMLSDDLQYLEVFLKDFVPGKENYQGAFIMFNGHLRDDSALRLISKKMDFEKVLGCFELHLNFVTFESNVFFTQNYHLKQMYKWKHTESDNTEWDMGRGNKEDVKQEGSEADGSEYVNLVSSRIASVCSVLNVFPRVSFHKGNNPMTKRVAGSVYKLLNDTLDAAASTNSELIIFDRSVDFNPLFIHEYTYQAFVYDLVNISYCSYKEEKKVNEAVENIKGFLKKQMTGDKYGKEESPKVGKAGEKLDNCYEFKFVTNVNKTEDRVALLDSESDVLWNKYRHMHIQKVNTEVLEEINEFSEKQVPGSKSAPNTALSNNKAMTTLQSLRNLPNIQYLLEKYWAHISLTEKCFDLVKAKNLIKIGTVEQMIATNMDSSGKHMSHSKCFEKMVELLSEDIEELDKVRIILLYLVNYNNLNNSHLEKLSSQVKLSEEAAELVQGVIDCLPIFGDTGLSGGDKQGNNSPNSSKSKKKEEEKAVHRLEKNDLYNYYKKQNAEFDLSRYMSEIVFIVFQYLNNKFTHLSIQDYSQQTPMGDREGKKSPRFKEDSLKSFKSLFHGESEVEKNKKKVIVYVLGGITFSECREMYKLSELKNLDIYIGGDEILIPSQFLQSF